MPEKNTSPAKIKAANTKAANTKAGEKQARRANALRENLRRRKAQTRGKIKEHAKTGSGEDGGAPSNQPG